MFSLPHLLFAQPQTNFKLEKKLEIFSFPCMCTLHLVPTDILAAPSNTVAVFGGCAVDSYCLSYLAYLHGE